MIDTKEKINRIEKLIEKYSKRRDKIENGNYILAMELKKIQDGELRSLEDVVKWCFEMMKTGDEVRSIMGEWRMVGWWNKEEKRRNFKKRWE